VGKSIVFIKLFWMGVRVVKHLIKINKGTLHNLENKGCGECQTSCQSACKTSCTVGNQKCENE